MNLKKTVRKMLGLFLSRRVCNFLGLRKYIPISSHTPLPIDVESNTVYFITEDLWVPGGGEHFFRGVGENIHVDGQNHTINVLPQIAPQDIFQEDQFMEVL